MNPKLLDWCRRMIRCRSVTTEGTREMAQLCANELLAPAGIAARLIPSAAEGNAQVNLIATIEGEDSSLAPIVLNTHLDTVPPGDLALWTEAGGDPFNAAIKDDRIYGLGAADTKLDFLAKATALIEVGRPRRNVWLAATFGEEHGLVGAKELAAAGMLPARRARLRRRALDARSRHGTQGAGLVFRLELRFEPVALSTPVDTRRVLFVGRSAHSSTPALGKNAIIAALEAIAEQSGSPRLPRSTAATRSTRWPRDANCW